MTFFGCSVFWPNYCIFLNKRKEDLVERRQSWGGREGQGDVTIVPPTLYHKVFLPHSLSTISAPKVHWIRNFKNWSSQMWAQISKLLKFDNLCKTIDTWSNWRQAIGYLFHHRWSLYVSVNHPICATWGTPTPLFTMDFCLRPCISSNFQHKF